MAIAASELADEARCYSCLGMSNAEALILALERRWLLALDAAADVTPAALMDYVKCWFAAGGSTFEKLQMGLLGNIEIATVVADFVARSGITDETQIAALNELVSSAKQHGWWDKCDLIYPFAGGTALAHSQNLKSSSFTITWNGAVTHDANGITGDDATGFGDTGYVPSTNRITQTSGHISIYKRIPSPSVGGAFGSRSTVSSTRRVFIRPGTTSVEFWLTSTFSTQTTAALGFMAARREDASRFFAYYGGTDHEILNTSNGVVDLSLYLLALHQTTGAIDFSGDNLSAATAGTSLTASEVSFMSSDWQTFQTALGRQV